MIRDATKVATSAFGVPLYSLYLRVIPELAEEAGRHSGEAGSSLVRDDEGGDDVLDSGGALQLEVLDAREGAGEELALGGLAALQRAVCGHHFRFCEPGVPRLRKRPNQPPPRALQGRLIRQPVTPIFNAVCASVKKLHSICQGCTLQNPPVKHPPGQPVPPRAHCVTL